MKKKLLSEAAKEILDSSKKQGSQDAPKKLDGEVKKVVGATPTAPLKASDKPEFATNPEDNSKPKKTAKAGDAMKGLPTSVVPGQSISPAPHMESKEEDADMTIDEALDIIKNAFDEESFKAFSEDLDEAKDEAEAVALISSVLDDISEAAEQENEEAPQVVTETEAKPLELTFETPKVNVSEHLDALFAADTTLSEDFKKKAATILETAVNSSVAALAATLKETAEKALNEAVTAESAKASEALTEKFDETVAYVAQQWLQENEVAIEANLRTELTEDFIAGLRTLLTECYIDIPEDKVDVVESLATKLDETTAALNEQIEANAALNATILEVKKVEIVNLLAEGLTDIEAEKFHGLTDALESTLSEKDYAVKAKDIRETYFAKAEALTEETKQKVLKETVEEKVTTADENDTQVLTEGANPEGTPVKTPANDDFIAEAARLLGGRKAAKK